MIDKTYDVLFLCTGNSARSILAESILNQFGKGKIPRLQCRQSPTGQVHPLAIKLLTQLNFPTAGLRSKSWDEFAAPRGSAPGFRVHGL